MKLRNGKGVSTSMIEPEAKVDSDRDTLLNAAVLRWMQELAPQGILLTDSALNVVGWNRWLEEHSGRRSKDVLGKNLLELYPDLIERGLDASYKDALSGQVRLLSQRFHGYLLPMAPQSSRNTLICSRAYGSRLCLAREKSSEH
jgi:PAS domain-containing protein